MPRLHLSTFNALKITLNLRLKTNLLLVFTAILCACTAEDHYNSMIADARKECHSLPQPEIQRCLDELMDYDEYKRMRDAAIDAGDE